MMRKIPYILLFLSFTYNSWTQVYTPARPALDGEASTDNFGFKTKLSGDGTRMAVSAPYNDANGLNAGEVKIYQKSATAWVQMGSSIPGEGANDISGFDISFSDDGSTLAIGAPQNDGNGTNSGHVRVYAWNGSNWVQRGADINGAAARHYFGQSVSLSADGTVLAVGNPQIDPTSQKYSLTVTGEEFKYYTDQILLKEMFQFATRPAEGKGYTQVFDWNGSSWVQRGTTINGINSDLAFGSSVRLSLGGDTLAIGAPLDMLKSELLATLGVYHWNGSSWAQLGSNITYSPVLIAGSLLLFNGYFGHAISLSGNGSRILANTNYGIYVYSWSGSAWTNTWVNEISTLGSFMVHPFDNTMSKDGNTIGICDSYIKAGSINYLGQIRIYEWNGTSFDQVFNYLKSNGYQGGSDYDAAKKQFGLIRSIAISSNDDISIGSGGFVYVDSSYTESITSGRVMTFIKCPAPSITTLQDTTVCNSFNLPALASGTYYTGPLGTGTTLSAGTTINTTQTIYIYAPNVSNPWCFEQDSFKVTVVSNSLGAPSNSTYCDSYDLPPLKKGDYYTGPNGTGTKLLAGKRIFSTKSLYAYAPAEGLCPAKEESFTITINQVNSLISTNNNILTSEATGATYQWLNCTNGYLVIPGATSQSYTPTVKGSYALKITENGCTDTSYCVPVSFTPPGWKMVEAGGDFTIAIKNDSTLWSWGANAYGQLGLGSTIDTINPQTVSSFRAWKTLSSGYGHTLALTYDSLLYSWGDNSSGQLGNGVSGFGEYSAVPERIGADKWIAIGTGDFYSFGIKEDGSLWGWGSNGAGQLGLGNYTSHNSPTLIDHTSIWKEVSGGDSHAMAIKSNGTLWVWGDNTNGQLGLGNNTASLTPTQLGSDSWSKVSAGNQFTMAIKSDGTLWAWGANTSGEVGNGSSGAFVTSPYQVGTASNWTQISTSFSSASFARKSDNTLWAWGSNYYGQLGDGSNTNRLNPQQVSGSWTDIAAGSTFTVGLKNGNTGHCATGENDNGELGNNSKVSTNSFGCLLDCSNINTRIESDDANMIALESGATSYQWLRCNANGTKSVIAGATSQTYSPASESGIYSVVISKNGCVDTSDCFTLVTDVRSSLISDAQVSAYPNPSNGEINLVFGGNTQVKKVLVYHYLGQFIEERTLSDQRSAKFQLTGASGLYFITVIYDNDQMSIVKVMKE